MGPRQRRTGVRQPWQSSHALLLLPIALIVVITVVDVRFPADIHLGPALVIAPAITASFAGPWTTGLIGALAVAAQVVIGDLHGGLATPNHIVQIVALAVLSVLVVIYCAVRDRRRAQLDQVRSVAEAAQHVLMSPLPERIGQLRIASLYLAAEDEAQIGGDLYAATRADDGAARILIGDVRGKGLPAVGEAALLLGAFREAAHRQASLPDLAATLEQSVTRYAADFEPPEEAGERFATALLAEVPDGDRVIRMTSCGHPPPLLLRADHTVSIPKLRPSPPLGVRCSETADHALDVFPFESGDTFLLYTDGVVEARDSNGRFYPLAERVAQWAGATPEALLHHIRRDLLHHCDGCLGDDAALVALHHTSTAHRRLHGRNLEAASSRMTAP
ncbi:PP2C family protein-serine/threonine phosphatase [Streptomyces sp. NPDC046805]|uniref:PP2C family protein-serine/threonine phosphatase n=1 Tax=Streptomyces sp. NPDC046805 TaxID=3155134 RepID=UPI0033E09913